MNYPESQRPQRGYDWSGGLLIVYLAISALWFPIAALLLWLGLLQVVLDVLVFGGFFLFAVVLPLYLMCAVLRGAYRLVRKHSRRA